MSQIISETTAEYICPNCNKKSSFSSVLPTNGTFKISCYYCNYVSDVVYEKLPQQPINNLKETDSSIEAYIEEMPFQEPIEEKYEPKDEKIEESIEQEIEQKQEEIIPPKDNIITTIAKIFGFSKRIVKINETLPFIEKKTESETI